MWLFSLFANNLAAIMEVNEESNLRQQIIAPMGNNYSQALSGLN
jgi:hypothetical protein